MSRSSLQPTLFSNRSTTWRAFLGAALSVLGLWAAEAASPEISADAERAPAIEQR